MKSKFVILLSGIALCVSLSGCGTWWATTSLTPDIYLDDYYTPGYYDGIYSPGYGIWTPPPGGYNPPPPPPPRPDNPRPPYNPGYNPGGNPGGRPETPNISPGTPEQGGFRGMYGGSGASSTH